VAGLDCGKYREALDKCKWAFPTMLNTYGNSVARMAGALSTSSGVPYIAVAKYLMLEENYGHNEELAKDLESAMMFYRYDITGFKNKEPSDG